VSAVDAPLTGEALLAAVTEAMVSFHQRYYHRKPVTAKTLLLCFAMSTITSSSSMRRSSDNETPSPSCFKPTWLCREGLGGIL
jgi:hypothetical protein